MSGSPFVWSGDDALSYEELQKLRKRQRIKVDTSPVQHWTQGAARVANALFGAIGDSRINAAEEANAAYNQGLTAEALKAGLLPLGMPTDGGGAAPAPRAGNDARVMTLPPEAQEPGAAQTASLIQNFEGYRAKPYWDVNAFRVGFGSDTITDPATGEVRKVQKGDVINPEMAMADLQRRIPEFQAKVADQTPAFASLPDAIKAPLTSVAYNYGSLPKSVARAVEAGDPATIAAAVRGLSGHNGGVNARRRNTEAELIQRASLSGGSGGDVRGGAGQDTLAPVAMDDEQAAALEAQMGGGMVVPPPVAMNDAESAAIEAQMSGGMVAPPREAFSAVPGQPPLVLEGEAAQAGADVLMANDMARQTAAIPGQVQPNAANALPPLPPPVLAPAIPGERQLPQELQGLPATAPLPPPRPPGLGVEPPPVQPAPPPAAVPPGAAVPPPAVARVAAAMGGAPMAPGNPAYDAMSGDLSPSAVMALNNGNRDAQLASLIQASPQARPVPPGTPAEAFMSGAGLASRAPFPAAPGAASAAPVAVPATSGAPIPITPPGATAQAPATPPPAVQRVAQAAIQTMDPAIVRALTDPRASPGTRAVAQSILQRQMQAAEAAQRRQLEIQDRKDLWTREDQKEAEKRKYEEGKTEFTADRYGRLYNKRTGEYKDQAAAAGPAFRALTDANERAKFGIPAEDRTPYQVGPDGQLHSPPKGTNVTVDSGGSPKQIFERMEKSTDAAQAAATGLGAIRQAREAIAGGAIFGAGADMRLGLQKIGALLGADTSKIENTETFRSAIAPQVSAMLKATVGSANISNSDREFAEKAAGGSIVLDQGSVTRLLDIMERANGAVLEGHQKRLDAVYPDNGQYTRERALFLPVMAPAPVPGAAAPATPAPASAAPEATKVVNGKTYVKRGGQWYEGN